MSVGVFVCMHVYWLLFLRNRADVIQGSEWTILQEGTVLSSTDDEVITMEMLGNSSIRQKVLSIKRLWQICEAWGGLGNCPQTFLIPEFTSSINIQIVKNVGK